MYYTGKRVAVPGGRSREKEVTVTVMGLPSPYKSAIYNNTVVDMSYFFRPLYGGGKGGGKVGGDGRWSEQEARRKTFDGIRKRSNTTGSTGRDEALGEEGSLQRMEICTSRLRGKIRVTGNKFLPRGRIFTSREGGRREFGNTKNAVARGAGR